MKCQLAGRIRCIGEGRLALVESLREPDPSDKDDASLEFGRNVGLPLPGECRRQHSSFEKEGAGHCAARPAGEAAPMHDPRWVDMRPLRYPAFVAPVHYHEREDGAWQRHGRTEGRLPSKCTPCAAAECVDERLCHGVGRPPLGDSLGTLPAHFAADSSHGLPASPLAPVCAFCVSGRAHLAAMCARVHDLVDAASRHARVSEVQSVLEGGVPGNAGLQ